MPKPTLTQMETLLGEIFRNMRELEYLGMGDVLSHAQLQAEASMRAKVKQQLDALENLYYRRNPK